MGSTGVRTPPGFFLFDSARTFAFLFFRLAFRHLFKASFSEIVRFTFVQHFFCTSLTFALCLGACITSSAMGQEGEAVA